MKNGFIKASALSPDLRVAAVSYNRGECVRLAREAVESGARIIVFPELALTGSTAGDLFFQKTLLLAAERELAAFVEETAELDAISFIGLPAIISGRIYNVVAVCSAGDILAVVPAVSADARYFAPAPELNEEVSLAGFDTVFGTDIILTPDSLPELSIAVVVGKDAGLVYSPARAHATSGANLIVNPVAEVETAGLGDRLRTFAESLSRELKCAYVIAAAGEGESGTDGVYAARSVIAECGDILAEARPYEGGVLSAVIDAEKSALLRARDAGFEESADYDYISFELSECITKIENPPRRLPFVPDGAEALARRAEEILAIQAHGLAGRISRSRSTGAVIGVSGGLDSTLALLVAVRAFDLLGLDRKNITAVTMPCFGTTARTKGNAERLAESLGTSLRCIDIKAAVNQHFEDIGHDAENYSVVYENSQARERTQVLMDIANSLGALVVGTGDLSELALGWATYNGDHMSMYGVNSGVPKTLMRHLVSYSADECERLGDSESAAVLRDVLATPVSPELLPPKDGEIAQCTEGIVGPYELHDFFLYYTVRYGFSPEKVMRLAEAAFAGEYEREVILSWLKVFLRRFFTQQFKRSCLPDGPKIGTVGLSPRGDFRMPSDASFEEWLEELK